jgi:DNA repair protein RecO (recombination protein O)
MLYKTKGIVLHAVKYSDTAWIVTVYTEQFGRESYMVYGVNKKKSVFRAAYLHPLTQVEMNVSHSPGKEIHQIKDVQITIPHNEISSHPVKNAIALFLSELLFKTLRVAEPDTQLYDFLENSALVLEHSEIGIANFHLLFMVSLTRYLGFTPSSENMETGVFDLMNGIFTNERPQHTHYLSTEDSRYLAILLKTPFSEMHNLSLDRNLRNKLIDHLLTYYRLHVTGFNGVQSIDVLRSLFD